jgi:predicted nucleic acid-binding protein
LVRCGSEIRAETSSRGAIAAIAEESSSPTLTIHSRVDLHAAARDLMRKYRDVPMDYADATLVELAEELDTGKVVTQGPQGKV